MGRPEIVVYGLGSLSNRRSVVQLALAHGVASALLHADSSRSIFDPIHSAEENAELLRLGWYVIPCDELGKRACKPSERILFFMPHCDRWLYCNVVEENLAHLDRIMIFGNSFRNYTEIKPDVSDRIEHIARNTTEHHFTLQAQGMIDKQLMFDSFNDCCLMHFS